MIKIIIGGIIVFFGINLVRLCDLSVDHVSRIIYINNPRRTIRNIPDDTIVYIQNDFVSPLTIEELTNSESETSDDSPISNASPVYPSTPMSSPIPRVNNRYNRYNTRSKTHRPAANPKKLNYSLSYKWTGENCDCSICLEEITKKSLIKQLKCLHIYHVKCIDDWLQIKSRCPLCNAEIKI